MYETSRHLTLVIWSSLIIFNLNVATVDSEIVLAGYSTDDQVNSLHAISAKEALPAILFATTKSDTLERPSRLIQAEIKDGRLASGTKFQAKSSDQQIFFCPRQDDAEKCLAPKQFGESQVLECEAELKPILERSPAIQSQDVPCGVDGIGTRLRFVYKPYSYNTQHINLYSICYNNSNKKVLYAYHVFSGPAMLSEKLLTRERRIKFEMDTETYELIDETYNTYLKAEAESKPQYKLQQLVPSEDMALAWLIKPTHHFMNFALQHEDLIEPWTHIKSLIRTYAEQLHIRPHTGQQVDKIISIMTGEFDIPENETTTSADEKQRSSVWVVIIVDKTETLDIGLAIVMNNFIAKSSENENQDGSNAGETSSAKQYIDKLCEDEDLSADSLKEMFKKVGGQVRCCRVTNKIMYLTLPSNLYYLPYEALRIPNLTKSLP